MSKFGELYGTPISNSDTILSEIDKEFGRIPSIEYIIAYPIGMINLPFGFGTLTWNSYGHSVLRYIDPNGNDVIANIEAKENGKEFIQFYKPSEYLYGVDPQTCGAQRGVYNRNFVGIRIYGIKNENIEEMHKHIKTLIANEHITVEFNIIIGPILNFFREYFPFLNIPEFGNCSKWTSTMLQKANVIEKTFVWPRTIFIDIFEMAKDRGFETDVVFYEKPDHVENLALGVKNKSKSVWFEGIAPFQFIRNWFYGDLREFSNIIVRSKLMEDNTTKATIILNNNVVQPSKLRNILNNPYVIGINVTCSMYITYKAFKYIRKLTRK